MYSSLILIWTNGLPPGTLSFQGVPFVQSDRLLSKGYPPIDQFWLANTSLLPIPTPIPVQSDTGGRTWTNEEWTKKLTEYVRLRQPKLLTFSEMGKMGGRPRKHP